MFASDLDGASRRQLDRGARLTELLRQGQYHPYPVEDQVVSVWAGINGHFDDIAVEDLLRFEGDLLEHLRRNTPILATIVETQKWDDDTANAVVAEINKVKEQFKASAKQAPAGDETHAKALGDDQVDAEKIVVQKG